MNKTADGRPAWADSFHDWAQDWVSCDGEYLLCYYAMCNPQQRPATWAPTVRVTDCPCDKHHGLYMVMINGILDADTHAVTRERCPHGLLSCPTPNTAPVCEAAKSMYAGSVPGAVAAVSAWSFRNMTRNGNPLDFANCPTAGAYAGCMTAPCFGQNATGEGAGEDAPEQLRCECPIYDGLFSVAGSLKAACQAPARTGVPVPSAAYHPALRASDTPYSLRPSAACEGVITSRVCYEGSLDAMLYANTSDPFGCPHKGATILSAGECWVFGFPRKIGPDPVLVGATLYHPPPRIPEGQLLERCEKGFVQRSLRGRRALVITTSHGVLGPANCTTCKGTGVAAPEFTNPYYVFLDANMSVDLASIDGGTIPIDTEARYMTKLDLRFFNDLDALAKANASLAIADVDFSLYDVVYMAGGWGAAWDLGTSPTLASGVSTALRAGRLVGSVCHGALGLINAVKPGGGPLVANVTLTAVTDRQIQQLGIAGITPLHPETELRKRGADFRASHGVLTDIDQSLVVRDGPLVTGQNQNSACETAQWLVDCVYNASCTLPFSL